MRKIYDDLKKLADLQKVDKSLNFNLKNLNEKKKENLKCLNALKENPIMKTETDAKDFTGLTQWNDYLNFSGLNLENAKESQIIQNLEIILKKIEVVNIAQGNLSNYIDNLDYAINLYENKRSSLIGRYLILLFERIFRKFIDFIILQPFGKCS